MPCTPIATYYLSSCNAMLSRMPLPFVYVTKNRLYRVILVAGPNYAVPDKFLVII